MHGRRGWSVRETTTAHDWTGYFDELTVSNDVDRTTSRSTALKEKPTIGL